MSYEERREGVGWHLAPIGTQFSKFFPNRVSRRYFYKTVPEGARVSPFHVMTMILIQTFQRSGLQVKREKEFVIVE